MHLYAHATPPSAQMAEWHVQRFMQQNWYARVTGFWVPLNPSPGQWPAGASFEPVPGLLAPEPRQPAAARTGCAWPDLRPGPYRPTGMQLATLPSCGGRRRRHTKRSGQGCGRPSPAAAHPARTGRRPGRAARRS